MKINKLFVGALGFVALVLASCSAASVTQGTYSGTYNAYGYSGSNGNATAVVSLVNDNTVNVKVASSGNPDVTIDNVTLVKTEVLGVINVNFSGSNSSLSITGDYTQVSGINTLDVSIDSTSSSAYISFTGKK